MIRIKSIFSLLLGSLCAILLHYTLYRMGLPIAPFIYQAF